MRLQGWGAWVDPAFPITGPNIDWSVIEQFVLHYTAAVNLPDGDFGEYEHDIPPYLRAIQRMYLAKRPVGYSIGYNEAGDWLGGVWIARGPTIRCAANAVDRDGGRTNRISYAFLCLVDGQGYAPPLMVEAIRLRYANACRLAGYARGKAWHQLHILGHNDLEPTGCPGTGIQEQIERGVFAVSFEQTLPSPPTPTPGANDMKPSIFYVNGCNAVFCGDATGYGFTTHLSWTGPGSAAVDSALAAKLNAGAQVFHVEMSDLVNCTLLGSLPYGDVVEWRREHFMAVYP